MNKNAMDIESERIMLVGQDRVFYLGLLGIPSSRTFGSLTVYASLEKPFRLCLDGRTWEKRRLAVIPPYLPHRIETDEQMICSIMIEPESLDLFSFEEAFGSTLSGMGCQTALTRIHEAYAYLQTIGVGATVEGLSVDHLFFGQEIEKKPLDPRIAKIIEKIKRDPSSNYTAEECADETGLSFSRFLHLFRAEVGVTFRKFRAWKRARNLLYHVNRTSTLTDIALEIGYPDSTHFSHSIRQFYGLRPKEIFAGSRRLAILLQEPARIRCRRN